MNISLLMAVSVTPAAQRPRKKTVYNPEILLEAPSSRASERLPCCTESDAMEMQTLSVFCVLFGLTIISHIRMTN